jgi:hypothetical protein
MACLAVERFWISRLTSQYGYSDEPGCEDTDEENINPCVFEQLHGLGMVFGMVDRVSQISARSAERAA